MKKYFVAICVAYVLLLCPSFAQACEDCYGRGAKDPAGNIRDIARCGSSPSGSVEGCLVTPDGANCTLWSYGNSCPEPSGGTGAPGGGTGGSGGAGCDRDDSGTCPPSCTSCGGTIGGGGKKV
jgi:hypothetical protein